MTATSGDRAGARPRVCRVLLYLDGTGSDMALPADIPVAALIPALYDVLIQPEASEQSVAVTRLLTAPGRPALDPAKTLWENGITDGAMLTWAPPAPPSHEAPVIDAAATVAAAPRAPAWLTQPGVARGAGLAVAIVMAGVTGFLVVPGGPGLPDVLLAAAAVALVAVLSTAMAGATVAGAPAAVAALGLLCASAALVAILCGLSTAQAGIGLTVLSVALLTAANRLCVRMCGLAPTAGTRNLLGGLVAAAAGGAGLGVLATCALGADWPRVLLAAVVSMILLLRLRHHPEALPSACLLIAGTLTATTALVAVHRLLPAVALPLRLALPAVGCAAVWLGVHRLNLTLSPGAARLLTALEHLSPVCVLPLACWALGAFGMMRAAALP